MSTERIADIHCPSCGAPAAYDIRRGMYLCGYCGGKVEVSEAIKQKEGFRALRQGKLQEALAGFSLQRAKCSGCGAEVVFQENEAQANCAFCGRQLVRGKYLKTKNMPEIVIPFAITPEEAKERLSAWCRENAGKREAKKLSGQIGQLKGFYLPYEFVRGPVSCSVRRIDGGRKYYCGGFIDEVFVNTSSQLDNRLLDGCEPFDLEDLREFDFAYTAGHTVKVRDAEDKTLSKRVQEEVAESYTPVVRKTLETKAVSVEPDVSSVVRMPALMPVYYLRLKDTAAAVNGQTGKVSVLAAKESHYYFLPWWLKAMLATLLISAAAYGGMRLFGMESAMSLMITLMLGFVIFIITLVAYSDTQHTKFRIEKGRKVFTSKGGRFVRRDGVLVQEEAPMERRSTPPVFFETINGKRQEVVIRFSSAPRMVRMAVLAVVVLFLPVICALLINGFDFGSLNLGGSAVWFCIFVPVVPIYLLKFGRIDMYDRPWFYLVEGNGTGKRLKRVKAKEKHSFKYYLEMIPHGIGAILGILFALACFVTMVYLTAGYDV